MKWLREYWQELVGGVASGLGFAVFHERWLWIIACAFMMLSTLIARTARDQRKTIAKMLATNNELQEAADAMIAHAFETSSKLRERIAILEAELEERDRSA